MNIKHLGVKRAYYNDPETVVVEVADGDVWHTCNIEPTWIAERYRIKPRTIRIGEIDVPEPEPLTCDECGAATDDPWHSSESGSRHFHRCDACHTAALEAQRVPEGWKLVPIEPTDEMIDAGCDEADAYRVDIDRAYRAMLSVSPEVGNHD